MNGNQLDYLNQIAPKPTNDWRQRFTVKHYILAGAAIVVLLLLVVSVIVIAGSGPRPLERLVARLNTTAPLVTDAQTKIKSSELRSANSNLKLYLTNTSRDIVGPATTSGINLKKLSKTVVDQENTAAVTARLEDARLNAVFDRTYAREMAYRLDTTLTLMRQTNASSSSASLKQFLSNAITNLEPIQQSFAEFDETR